MKCGKLSKYHKNEVKSEVYSSGKHDLLNVPLGLKYILNHFPNSRRGKLMVCGLDHSGSQPSFMQNCIFVFIDNVCTISIR